MKQTLERLLFFILGFFNCFVLLQCQDFCSPGSDNHSICAVADGSDPPPLHFNSQGQDLLHTAKTSCPFLTITFRVTAYCPCKICCQKYADGITASGHKIQSGDKFVAAPKEYPFGTRMQIHGYSDSIVIVQDRGGAIKGNRLDVFFPTHKEALEWGIKMVEVRVYQNE